MRSSFGTDKVRNKQCMSPLIVVDLTEHEQLLWEWLSNEYVVGVFLAPPCGSASRARQIPLKKRLLRRSYRFNHAAHGPRPLRSDRHPNGLPNLTFSENSRITIANKLYHLTAKVVQWANDVGCVFCVENPQYSLFWATTFWTSVAHLCMYTVFHSCQYGSLRKKKTMLAFNAAEFLAISARCPGQNSRHKHARWGLNRATNGFATAEETVYPMGLARIIAVIFVRIFTQCGVPATPETLDQLHPESLQSLQRMRAQVGQQSRASKMPPLVRTYKTKFFLQGPKSKLPSLPVFHRLRQPLQFLDEPIQMLPKGAKLLSLQHIPSSAKGGEGSVNVEDQVEFPTVDSQTKGGNFSQCNVFQYGNDDELCGNVPNVFKFPDSAMDNEDDTHLQIWGLPWGPEEFLRMAVQAGHPASLQSFLPERLFLCISKAMTMTSADRMQHRAQTLKHWLRRSLELKTEEQSLHAKLHSDVAKVLKGKRILLWGEMLAAIGYEDMGVVEEFKTGSSLVGATEITGLWPKKFTPSGFGAEEDYQLQAGGVLRGGHCSSGLATDYGRGCQG